MNDANKATKPQATIILSYWPLLNPADFCGPGDYINLNSNTETERLFNYIETKYPNGNATSCVWFRTDEEICAALIMPKALAIRDHLLNWAEQQPLDWFNAYLPWYEDDTGAISRYGLFIIPTYQQSLERCKLAREKYHGKQSKPDDSFIVIYQTLSFVSKAAETFATLNNQIGTTLPIYLADEAAMEKVYLATPGESTMNMDDFHLIARFPLPPSHRGSAAIKIPEVNQIMSDFLDIDGA